MLAKRQADSEAKTAEAREDAIAATIRNQTKIDAAKADAEVARLKLAQKEALLLEAELYVMKANADARVEAAKNMKELRVLPAGSGLLHHLDD